MTRHWRPSAAGHSLAALSRPAGLLAMLAGLVTVVIWAVAGTGPGLDDGVPITLRAPQDRSAQLAPGAHPASSTAQPVSNRPHRVTASSTRTTARATSEPASTSSRATAPAAPTPRPEPAPIAQAPKPSSSTPPAAAASAPAPPPPPPPATPSSDDELAVALTLPQVPPLPPVPPVQVVVPPLPTPPPLSGLPSIP
jgi:homeobox protein ESX1